MVPRARGPDQPEILSDLEKIERSGHILLAIINDVLDPSIIEAGRYEIDLRNVDVADVLKDVYNGIRPEDLGKLFRPFSQVDNSAARKFDGTGLGLAISKKPCQMMGGDIAVESEPGKGSCFSLRVPASGQTTPYGCRFSYIHLSHSWAVALVCCPSSLAITNIGVPGNQGIAYEYEGQSNVSAHLDDLFYRHVCVGPTQSYRR